MPAIWQIRQLKATHHRILWWFADAGAIGKILARDWQKQCASDLGIHRLTLRANVLRMIKWGILAEGPKRGEVFLSAAIFARHVDRTQLKAKDSIPTQGETKC